MDVNARICGIADAIVGATRSAATIALNKAAAQSRGATRTPDTNSLARTRTTPQGGNPAAYLASQQSGVTTNPNNVPGQPGYNPALPPNQPVAATSTTYNAANPYNVPGLPGYNPYQPTNPASGYNAQNPYNAPGLPGYNPYQPSTPQGTPYLGDPYGGGYGGPTAADLGLPDPGYSGGAPMSDGLDMSYLSDPADQNALASYFDPSSQLGPWSF